MMSTVEHAMVADFDIEALLQTVEGDESLAKELCRLFIQQSRIDLASIGIAFQTKHAEDLQRALHRLKGAAGAVCADTVAAIAHTFGDCVRAGDWQCAEGKWIALQQAAQRAVSAMCAYIETDPAGTTETRT